jgi:hypothetical protein
VAQGQWLRLIAPTRCTSLCRIGKTISARFSAPIAAVRVSLRLSCEWPAGADRRSEGADDGARRRSEKRHGRTLHRPPSAGLGKDRKGEFSPAIFLNDFAKLSDQGKRFYSSVGSGDVLPHLNDIATVSKKFVEAGKLANTSGTAGHNAAYTMLGGAAAGLMHGSLIEPITAVSTVVGNNLMARALSKPASAASVARWGGLIRRSRPIRVHLRSRTSTSPAQSRQHDQRTIRLAHSAG